MKMYYAFVRYLILDICCKEGLWNIRYTTFMSTVREFDGTGRFPFLIWRELSSNVNEIRLSVVYEQEIYWRHPFIEEFSIYRNMFSETFPVHIHIRLMYVFISIYVFIIYLCISLYIKYIIFIYIYLYLFIYVYIYMCFSCISCTTVPEVEIQAARWLCSNIFSFIK